MELNSLEVDRFLWLRAAEWANWPSFVSQPIVPCLLIFYPWYYILGGVFVLDILWASIRYTYVNVTAATKAVIFVSFLKWPAAVFSAIYLLRDHRYLSGALAIAWPLGLCGVVGIPGQIGRIELMFARKMGLAE
jgi:hypothetical protein